VLIESQTNLVRFIPAPARLASEAVRVITSNYSIVNREHCALISSWDSFQVPPSRGSARAFTRVKLATRHHPLNTNGLLVFALMPHPQLTAASSSNFQLIFNNALKAYEKRTRKDLLAHPLVAQLEICDSPSAILAILHQQVQGLDQSRDNRWTKWLDPTVNVLFALSATLAEGVGLVCFRTSTCLISAHSRLFGRYSHLEGWYSQELGSSF
jgi:hypothetical protein